MRRYVYMMHLATTAAAASGKRRSRPGVENEPPRTCISSDEDGAELRPGADGKGDGVVATRDFTLGETVLIGFLLETSTQNDSHATQLGPTRWGRHGGLGQSVNHSCDPNCGVRLNESGAFDLVARRSIRTGEEVTIDYAMRNFTIEHFPAVCLCRAAACRESITGWKDLPADRKADYRNLVAPYLLAMDAPLD